MLIRLRKPLSMYGSSCKSGSLIIDSRSTTPIENLGSGLNHMVDTMALYLQSESYDVVVSTLLTSTRRYFLKQNDAIRKGSVKGEIINLKTLGIGNGITVRCSECLAG